MAKQTYLGKSENNKAVLEVLDISRKTGSPAILWGEPGIGKTELVKTLAYRENLKLNGIDPDDPIAVAAVKEEDLKELFPLRILIGATIEPSELQGLPVLRTITMNDGSEATITQNTMPSWCYDLTQAGTGILFLDELNSASPAVQAGELSLLQGRLVGQYKLPDNVWIIGAANPTETAVNGWALPAPLANRLLHIYMEPDNNDFIEGFRQGWGQDITIEEQKVRAEITGFLSMKKNFIQVIPEDEETGGGAWASRRSWDNAAKNMALAENEQVQRMILSGFVGEDISEAFFVYKKAIKLPKTEDLLNSPTTIIWNDFQTDSILQILTNVIDNVELDNIDNSVQVFVSAANANKTDIALIVLPKLIERIKKVNNGVMNPKMLAPIFKTMGEDLKYLQL